nr:methanol oxidation system protein MoxJ [Methylocapsa palsarum]
MTFIFGGFDGFAANAAPADRANADAREQAGVLRICAAKNQPPLSLEDGSGFENKIAVVLAEAMNRKAQFVWYERPAIYLVRDQLDKNACDVIVGLDSGDPRVATSKPYYRTGYVFVTRADRDLNIKSWSDQRLAKLGHIAVSFGSPGEVLLKDIGQYENNMAYLYSLVNFKSARNEYTQVDPAKMVGEVSSGGAELAVAFAPDVARYVKASVTPLRISLIDDDAVKRNGEKVPQRFDQSVGVRHDDTALLEQIDAALVLAKPKIDAILQVEGVPLVPISR